MIDVITKEHYRYGAFILACILVVIGLYGCGNSEEKAEAKTGPTLEKYVDDYKKSMAIAGDVEKMEDEENSYVLTINENVMLFINVDDKKNVTTASLATRSAAFGSKELEKSQKALIYSVEPDYNEKQIYATMDELKVSDQLKDVAEFKSLDDVKLSYVSSVDKDTAYLKAEYK